MELNEQTLRQILTEQREEYQRQVGTIAEDLSARLKEEYGRHFGAAAEGFRTDVQLVAEGHAALREELAATRQEFQQSQRNLAADLGSAFQVLSETLKGIQQELTALREMVAQNTEDISLIKMELSVIRSDLKEKVGRDEFAILEARVTRLESSPARR